jgi:hypothetical protein
MQITKAPATMTSLELVETISNEGLQADTAIREALRQRGLSDGSQ